MEDLIQKIRLINKGKNKIIANYFPWHEYADFEAQCEEDGGIIETHFQIYKRFWRGKKITKIEDLIEMIEMHNNFPYLHSKGKNKSFFYDLHIWMNGYYFIFNAHYNKLYEKKLSLIERLFKSAKIPEWSE